MDAIAGAMTKTENFVDVLKTKMAATKEESVLDPRTLWDEEEWQLFKALENTDTSSAPPPVPPPPISATPVAPLPVRLPRPVGTPFMQSGGRRRSRAPSLAFITQREVTAHEDDYDTDLEEATDNLMPWISRPTPSKKPLRPVLHQRCCRRLGIVPIQHYIRHINDNNFSMRHRGMPVAHAQALSAPMTLSSNYNRFDLEGNYMGPEAARHFCTFLLDNHKLTHINLSMNNIGSTASYDICHALTTCPNLRHVELSSNHFGDSDGEHFMTFMMKCRSMRYLDLSNNEFSSRGASYLARALGRKNQLQSLDLSFNHIRLKGAELIAKALGENTHLKRLYLSRNGFGVTGTLYLAWALTENSSLELLDLSDNRIPFAIINSFAKCFKVNKTLRQIKLCSNPISADGAFRFVKVVEDCDESALELFDIRDLLVTARFLECVERIKEKRPSFTALVGYVSTGKDTNKAKKERFTDDNPLVTLLIFMSQRNMRLVDLFKSLDKDQSMSLTREEFIDGLKQIETPLSEAQLNELINMLDKDGDGEVDLKEIMNINEEFKDLKMKATKKARDAKRGRRDDGMLGTLDEEAITVLQELNRLKADSDEETV